MYECAHLFIGMDFDILTELYIDQLRCFSEFRLELEACI